MSKTKKLELKRQIFHLLFGILLVTLLYFNILSQLTLFILTIATIFGSLLAKNYEIVGITHLLNHFERKHDHDRFPARGLVFYLISAFIVISFFPFDIALASILILALADSVSHLCGLHFGKVKHPFTDKKNLEGMLAGFVAGFAGALIFLPWPQALIGALAAVLIEGIEVKAGKDTVNDNLTIPIVAAILMFVFRLAFG